MLDHVPGLFTSTMPAMVRPRKTSSETNRLGFAAKSLGDIFVCVLCLLLRPSLFDCYLDLKVYVLECCPIDVLNASRDRRATGCTRAHDRGGARQDCQTRKAAQGTRY